MPKETKKITNKRDDEVNKLLASYGNLSARGALKYFCGDLIARGRNRIVYELKQDPDYVVKLMRSDVPEDFSNIKEWLLYGEIAYWDNMRKWLAKPVGMNQTGSFIVMERCDVGLKKDYPTHIPHFFTDMKLQNFGFSRHDGRFCCFDYGSCVMLSAGLDPKKLRRAKWWDLGVKRPRKLNVTNL